MDNAEEDFPKHIAYKRGRFETRTFHAVSRTPDETETVCDFIDGNGYVKLAEEPVSEMSEDARRQLVECEDIGFRWNPDPEEETFEELELPF